MPTREEFLVGLRDQVEEPLWRMADALSATLEAAVFIPHFDAADEGAIGSIIHASLEGAALDSDLHEYGLELAHYRKGPARKVTGQIAVLGVDYRINAEFHIGGPKGGTSKSAHQFAPDECFTPDLFGLDKEQDETLLFIVYFLNEARSQIDRLFIVFADGVGREKIELRRIESAGAMDDDGFVEPHQTNDGVRLNIKSSVGERKNDEREDKREDASTGS